MSRIKSEPSRDYRERPLYTIGEAASYLRIPVATLRSWVMGRHYPAAGERKLFHPVLEIADRRGRRLSFINLVEAHVLDALRREHKIQLPKVRKAIEYLKKEFHSTHPLADQQFATDGLDLFVHEYGHLINISREGQLAMKAILEACLKHIVRDPKGVPIKLYLSTRRREVGALRAVVIDPAVSFGRPTLEGTNITTIILAERFTAGDSMEDLAEDYGRPKEEIEETIRYVLKAA